MPRSSFGRLAALVALCAVPLAAAAQAEAPPVHVRGDVVRLDGDTLLVRTRGGTVVPVALGAQTPVSGLARADASALTDGAFIGTTAVAQADGTLRAVEVHVFPESMRGRGEGHRPWDLQAGASMTNGTMSGTGSSGGGGEASMTNGTVAGATGAGGDRSLTVRYAGGEQTVRVPRDVPVVKVVPGDRALLRPGAHVFAIAGRGTDSVLTARAVLVGEGKLVPPM